MTSARRRFGLTPAAALALASGLFYFAFMVPVIFSADGHSMFEVAKSLLTKGTFDVSPSLLLSKAGRYGLHYSTCWPLLSIVALPFTGIGLIAAKLLNLSSDQLAMLGALALTPVLTALSVYLTALLALRLGASARGALIAALAFAFGTIAIVYTRDFFAEPLLSFLTLWAIYTELDPARHDGAISLLTGLAVLAKPTGIILAPLLAAHRAFTKRSLTAAAPPLLGAAAGVIMYLVYDYARFGSLFSTGQVNKFAIANFPVGLAGLLISPGRGLIWYCPVVFALAGLGRKLLKRPDILLIIAVASGYLFLYSFWRVWYGGWSWGPRLLMPALAPLLALAGLLNRRWRTVLITLTVIGFVINAPTLVCSYYNMFLEQRASGERPPRLVWSLPDAPMVRIWGVCYRDLRYGMSDSGEMTVGVAGSGNDDSASSAISRIPGIWWWKLPAVGMPSSAGMAISALLVGTCLWLISGAISATDDT